MSSLDQTFEELLVKLREPDALNPAKSDPILYFVYPPAFMLDLKQRLSRWAARLRQEGFEVVRISLSDLVWQIIDASGRWDAWLELEAEAEIEELNAAVSDVLRSQNHLVDEVARRVTQLHGNKLIFLTEAEMLHPWFRTRLIESRLHDRVTVPTAIFYPGRRSEQYGLHFLEIHDVDGNYRSTIVGGF
jgi:hypothetical protein